MSASHDVDIDKHVKTYITVFVTLMALTIITVAVGYLHLPIGQAVAVALLIATIKGGLVASYFMHLISERKLIYAVLISTVTLFVVLLLVPLFTVEDGTMIEHTGAASAHTGMEHLSEPAGAGASGHQAEPSAQPAGEPPSEQAPAGEQAQPPAGEQPAQPPPAEPPPSGPN
jgi:caa(3)-type oxidase subunit IV